MTTDDSNDLTLLGGIAITLGDSQTTTSSTPVPTSTTEETQPLTASFKSVTIPRRGDSRSGYLARRCDACQPLGIFRDTDDDYTLAYDEFGIFVNKQGDLGHKTDIIEWERKAEYVTPHPPYILLFCSQFIHIDIGRPVQIIPDKDIRCVCDGREANFSPSAMPGKGFDSMLPQEPRVHVIMNVAEGIMGESGQPVTKMGVLQHVFELVPTTSFHSAS